MIRPEISTMPQEQTRLRRRFAREAYDHFPYFISDGEIERRREIVKKTLATARQNYDKPLTAELCHQLVELQKGQKTSRNKEFELDEAKMREESRKCLHRLVAQLAITESTQEMGDNATTQEIIDASIQYLIKEGIEEEIHHHLQDFGSRYDVIFMENDPKILIIEAVQTLKKQIR
jgi:hypothetical protein